MKVNLVIPAKGESERVRGKNMHRINGKSLTYHACEKVLRCKNVNRVYLDTDCEDIIFEVKPLEDLIVLRRPKELANNDITANDLMVWALHMTEDCDLLLQTFATSPLITAKTIDTCIEKFVDAHEKYGCDSFFTVIPVQEYFWKGTKPLNFDPNALPNSFQLETLHMETHGLYGITTSALIECQTRVGQKPILISIPKSEALDIDTLEDIQILERMMQ